MKLICPHCQQQLDIADEHSGQILKCPHCSAMFMAPSMPTVIGPPAGVTPPGPPPSPPRPSASSAPPLHTVPPPIQGTSPSSQQQIKVGAGDPGPLPGAVATSTRAGSEPADDDVGPELMPPGELTRIFSVRFNPHVLTWWAPVGLAVIFVLSFFPWYAIPTSMSLWGLAFDGTSTTRPLFAGYALFTFFLGLPLSVLSLLVGKKLVPLPSPLNKFRAWRSLVVAGVLGIGFLILFVNFLNCNFTATPVNPTTVSYKITFRLHFLMLVGLLLEFWVARRRKKDLPWPRLDLRW